MAKLVKQVIPVYPPLARNARISGVVHLVGIIAKDGTIRNLQLIAGHPLLARPHWMPFRNGFISPPY